MNLYTPESANYPRLNNDSLFLDPNLTTDLTGNFRSSIDFITDAQLMKPESWTRFVRQFTEQTDSSNLGWKGEYWGKMMRGATFVYSVTRDEKLYATLRKTVEDMLGTADSDGRISSYNKENELKTWDLWCRKYVLLGMQYFMEICPDEDFNKVLISSIESQLDAIMNRVGRAEGKIPITYTCNTWRGLNASSILEPVVRAYSLTGKKKYLEFAEHIVSEGFIQLQNLVELAIENKSAPYQYPITKAYEMISCFMGLLEYYRVTGDEKYKTAVVNFGEKILETDFTIIGGCGLKGELFDHSAARQATPDVGDTPQETCVTVTVMQLLSQLALLTGDSKYLDAFEISYYNAYLGSLNTNLVLSRLALKDLPNAVHEVLPFDSYSPLTSAPRGMSIGGLQVMPDGHYYGCCACIASAGAGLAGKMTLLQSKDGAAFGMYIPGSYRTTLFNDVPVSFKVDTSYPVGDEICITVIPDISTEFSLSLRIPAWCRKAELSVAGEAYSAECGMVSVRRKWNSGDRIVLKFDMPTIAHRPESYGKDLLMNNYEWSFYVMLPNADIEHPDMKRHVAFTRGPVVLAADESMGVDPSAVYEFDVKDGTIDTESIPVDNAHQLTLSFPLKNGNRILLTDYASAGKDHKSNIAAWIKCE